MTMGRKIRWRTGPGLMTHQVIEAPTPHILIDSRKELHGWWRGKRECTAERLLVNPYNGCAIDCFCCYAKALPGYFQLFRQQKIVTVCRDFDQAVSRQLDGLSVVSCGYLSPVTDPFQPVEGRYRLSEKIVGEFVRRNIPIEFVTKSTFRPEVVKLLRRQKHSFGQVSILTPHESLRRRLMSRGATTDELFGNLKRLAEAGIHAVCRIDPIVPYVTDDEGDLSTIVRRAADCGAKHIVASVMDIPRRMTGEILGHLDGLSNGLASRLKKLYREIIDGSRHADLDYRRGVFSRLREECDRAGVTFALCMEYRLQDGRPVGLNAEFISSANCEGIDIPVYVRAGERFQPAADCDGACLTCQDPQCGVEDLAMGRPGVTKRDFTLTDYRRWSRALVSRTLSLEPREAGVPARERR
jgi:DNA repair photolyase